MISLVFASANAHKVAELRELMAHLPIRLLSLADIGFTDDIPETALTLQGNAYLKAKTIADKSDLPCFADDTGLEVEALDGRPGVFSARYAGEPSDSAKNRQKLMEEMQGINNRRAQFRTVICLILSGQTHYFEGKAAGNILEIEQGTGGFGYDALFQPEGYAQSFADMSSAEKNSISHRAKAVQQLIQALAGLV